MQWSRKYMLKYSHWNTTVIVCKIEDLKYSTFTNNSLYCCLESVTSRSLGRLKAVHTHTGDLSSSGRWDLFLGRLTPYSEKNHEGVSCTANPIQAQARCQSSTICTRPRSWCLVTSAPWNMIQFTLVPLNVANPRTKSHPRAPLPHFQCYLQKTNKTGKATQANRN